MKHIIIITSGLRGILNASFELVHRLQADGFEVSYLSPKNVQDEVEAQGITFFPLKALNFDPAPKLPQFKGRLGKIRKIVYQHLHRKSRLKLAVQNLRFAPYPDLILELKPDLVLIDVELHEYILSNYKLKLPTILLTQWFSTWKRWGSPPLESDIIPGKGWRGSRLGIEWAWWKLSLYRRWNIFRNYTLTGALSRREALKQYARQISFPSHLLDPKKFPPPFVYRKLPVISLTIQELEFPHSPRPNLFYAGAMVSVNRVENHSQDEALKPVERILQEVKKKGRKLLYCNLSSMNQGDISFLKKLIKALQAQNEWHLIISLGSKLKVEDLGNIPDNVSVYPWTPQLQILAKADIAINHGGIHSIHECIHFQIPMLIYSGKQHDQNACAARVAYHGLGIMADKDQDNSQSIRGRITKLLSDKGVVQNLQRAHQEYEKYQSPGMLKKLLLRIKKENNL